jgi:hypothetical protein
VAPIVSKPPTPMAMAPTIFSFKVPCRTRGFCWRISFRDARLFHERTATASAGPRRSELLNPIADCAKLSCAPASSPLNWRTRMRIPIILAAVALVLSGCNANQPINPSGQANRCANDPSCNPYDPSSYAQNNVGIGR